jgi:hypothetical protein
MERMPEMKKSLVSFAAALAALLVIGASAHAQPIPWSYISTGTPSLSADAGGPSIITITGVPSGSGNGNSGIIIYNMTLSTIASPSSPDTFTGAPLSLSLSLTDQLATTATSGKINASGTVNFVGNFTANNVTSTSLFPVTNLLAPGGPIIGGVQWTTTAANQPAGTTWLSTSSASVNLGSDSTGWSTYTVTLGAFAAPGPTATTNNPGSIQALVTVMPYIPTGSGDGPPTGTPEPTSLVLAGLGLPLVVLVRRRMKKDQA